MNLGAERKNVPRQNKERTQNGLRRFSRTFYSSRKERLIKC